jgi:hypothetical protein
VASGKEAGPIYSRRGAEYAEIFYIDALIEMRACRRFYGSHASIFSCFLTNCV